MREFELYVRSRLAEADLIISKIPYRTGISISDRIVVKSLLRELALYKFVAMENKLTIVSDIDTMLVRVYTAIGGEVVLLVDTSFCETKRAELEAIGIEITSLDMIAIAKKYAGVQNVISIMSSEIDTEVFFILGTVKNGICVRSSEIETKKRGFENISAKTSISSHVSEVKCANGSATETSMVITSSDIDVRVGRYRLLSELDNLTLAEIDNMTLAELDFIDI